ncbi:hypothetical protein D3C73_828450 [compost metagenome]
MEDGLKTTLKADPSGSISKSYTLSVTDTGLPCDGLPVTFTLRLYTLIELGSSVNPSGSSSDNTAPSILFNDVFTSIVQSIFSALVAIPSFVNNFPSLGATNTFATCTPLRTGNVIGTSTLPVMFVLLISVKKFIIPEMFE